jgi:hypothetical protein
MRALIVVSALALAACQVEKDGQNDTITATLNGEVAENAAEDVGNFAEDVANGAENVAEDVGNEAEDVTDGNEAN